MAFFIDDEGNITLVQGDDGDVTFDGIPTDRNYEVFFAIQDDKRRPIGDEVSVMSNNMSSVVISVPSTLTDLLTVKAGQETAEYYYGVKICDENTGLEDTMILGNNEIGDLNTITVYPRKVKGLNGN
jgi:hypothetical protein